MSLIWRRPSTMWIGFLKDALTLKGFDPKWITWINSCARNPKFSVFINGRPRQHILWRICCWKRQGPCVYFTICNDTLLLRKYDDGMLNVLTKAIELFEWCSRQKVNREESAFSGINIDAEKLISHDFTVRQTFTFFIPWPSIGWLSQKKSRFFGSPQLIKSRKN